MRVVFVALGQEQLGISILSAVLRRAGHETALVFNPALFNDRYYFDVPVLRDVFNRDRFLIDEIAAAKPDLLAFSVLTPTYQWALDIARNAKQRIGMPVIFGGVHPSAVPAVCLENDCVDYVCVGEGEHAIVALCEALARGVERPAKPIANLWWKDARGQLVQGPNAAFIQDLDNLPFWDKELWQDAISVGDYYLTMSSRGCPYRCTFCFNNFFAKLPGKGGGKYVRQRSVEHQMNELLEMNSRYGIKYIEFTDDVFTVNKPWVKEFTARYKRELGIPFQCLVHPRFIDEDVARWLRDAGCVHVQMGVQSADEEYKRRVLLRMEKDVDLGKSLEALRKAGLGAKLDHILGLPGEPRHAQEEARVLYTKYPPKRIQTFWLTYVPGIDMTREALEQGILTPQQVYEIERGKSRIFRHSHLEASGEAGHAERGFYQRYDVLFRMMPLLPAWARERVRAEHLPVMNEAAANVAGFVFDLANALTRLDLETMIFAKHYARQSVRQLPEILFGSHAKKHVPQIRQAIASDWQLDPVVLPSNPPAPQKVAANGKKRTALPMV